MITIDIFSKKALKGKTIYRVFRVGHEIPATVMVRVYTNCEVTGLSYSGGYFKYNIFGTDEDGNRVFFMGFGARTDKTSHDIEELFLSKDEALAKREEILAQIEKDIEEYTAASRDKIKASKDVLEEARRNNPLVSEKELLELVTSAAE
jgi:hypothetical protein